MDAIHRILTGDEVRAAGLIPVSETQRKAMRAEMLRLNVANLNRLFQLPDGFIEISITPLTTNVRIHVEEKGGIFYDFVASDHITNEGALAYDPYLYNGGGKIITVDGISLRVMDYANTTIQVHGVEVKFHDREVGDDLKFPLQNPALAPRHGKKLVTKSVTGRCSSTFLNGAPYYADLEKYPDGTANLLTRMPMPHIWNVQAAPQYKWYGKDMLVVSGLKISAANSMSWTQEAMGDFPTRKHADSAIDIGGDIDTQLFKSEFDPGVYTERDTLDYEMAHSCVRTVDGVELFIVTDVKGDLYVYKTSDPSNAPAYVKVSPPYPAWVSDHSYNARWGWDFNSDGTKMVAVPYNSEVSSDVSVEDHEQLETGSTSCTPLMPYPPEYYDIEDPEYFSDLWYFQNGHNGYIRKNTPGFVEFDINISIVEGEINQVQLVLGRNDWYGESGVYYTSAAYEYNSDALMVTTVEAFTDVLLEGTPTSDSYMDTYYTDVSDDEHKQWTSTPGSYGSLEKIDVIWKMIRKIELDAEPGAEDEIVSQETLLRDFPLAREQHNFTGLSTGGCDDNFSSKLFDIYLLANTGNHGLTYFKYMQVIEACDLKSATYAVRSYDYYNKGYRIISNGHVLKSGGDVVDMSNLASHAVPVVHPEILGYWASIQIKSDFFNFIDTHPDGFMAMCIPDYYQADAPIEAWYDNINLVPLEPPNEMIDYIRMADGSEGTHKDLFNKAFNDNRQYEDYYAPMYLGQYQIESTHEDRGSFAVTGVWRKF